MKLVENPPIDSRPTASESTRWEDLVSSVKYWAIRQRRKLPYLVWYGDELDVGVTLSQDKLTDGTLEGAFQQFNSGAFVEVERILSDMGIGFDRGLGPDGRDWEWDWSLSGPISVRFRSRATRPEKRMERPKPRLVTSSPSTEGGNG